MFTELEFGSCLSRITPVLGVWHDTVVPAAIPPLQGPVYRPEYAWMWAYERTLKARIRGLLGRPIGPADRVLFGAGGVLSEALANSFLHGHGRRPDRPIELDCAVGRGGIAFLVRDQGPGFDVAAALARLTQGGTYFRVAGNGLRALAAAEAAEACYSEQGRCLTLLVPLGTSSPTAPQPQAFPGRP